MSHIELAKVNTAQVLRLRRTINRIRQTRLEQEFAIATASVATGKLQENN